MVLDEDGNLYCGGDFTSVDDIDANHVAMWDGFAWTPLGEGINNQVRSLAYSDGILYAGGQFTQADGNSAINIAMWDGFEWSPLGIGPNGTVYSLSVVGDDLYAGGLFQNAGGITVNNIARWDGENWNALGAGTTGPVNALTSNGTTLTAAGDFTLANGVPVNRIAQWNGTEWTALGTGVNNPVYALTQSGSDIYAGGSFTQAGGLSSAKRIAKWNGSTWSALGPGLGLDVFAIAVNDQNVFVGLSKSIRQWNGSAWIQLGSGTNGLVRTLANDRFDLYVGGFFTTAGNKESTYAAQAITAFEPNIFVELPEGTRLTTGSTVDFGNVAIDSTNGRYVFTVRNQGNRELTITTISLVGGDDLDFFDLDSSDTLNSLFPNETTTFSLVFLPTETGEKTIELEISSNDPDTPTFILEIKGTGVTAKELFDAAMAAAELTDANADPDAIPFDDGVENILKYGFNMDLTGPDAATLEADGNSGLPRYSLIEGAGDFFFRFEFLRRKGSGLIYTPQKSPDLDSPFIGTLADEFVEDIDLLWERVFVDEPVDLTTNPTCFGRLMVELPDELTP